MSLLLRGAALGRLGFFADSVASLHEAIELEGRLRHDTYVPPFALYELGAVHCAQKQNEEAKKVFDKCAAVSYDFNFEVKAARCTCECSLCESFAAGQVQDALGWRVGVDGSNEVTLRGHCVSREFWRI